MGNGVLNIPAALKCFDGDELIIDKGIRKIEWMKQQEKKAPRRRPRRVGFKPKTGTLFAIRNKRVSIKEASLRRRQVIITYEKTTTGDTNKYIVAPYSYKYRKLKIGWRKMLYAYDMEDKHIKSFAIANIRNVVLTDRKYPNKTWPVEI